MSDAFEFVRDGATTTGLRAALAKYDEPKLETFIVQGRGKAGDVAVGALRGAALDAKFDELAAAGELSPDAAATLKKLPKDLALHGRCFVVFGASSEVGPCRRLLERGATVRAVARRNVKKWADLIAYARTTAGTHDLQVVFATSTLAVTGINRKRYACERDHEWEAAHRVACRRSTLPHGYVGPV